LVDFLVDYLVDTTRFPVFLPQPVVILGDSQYVTPLKIMTQLRVGEEG